MSQWWIQIQARFRFVSELISSPPWRMFPRSTKSCMHQRLDGCGSTTFTCTPHVFHAHVHFYRRAHVTRRPRISHLHGWALDIHVVRFVHPIVVDSHKSASRLLWRLCFVSSRHTLVLYNMYHSSNVNHHRRQTFVWPFLFCLVRNVTPVWQLFLCGHPAPFLSVVAAPATRE